MYGGMKRGLLWAPLLTTGVQNKVHAYNNNFTNGITTGALSKLLLHDDHIGRAVNDLRRARQMRPLR